MSTITPQPMSCIIVCMANFREIKKAHQINDGLWNLVQFVLVYRGTIGITNLFLGEPRFLMLLIANVHIRALNQLSRYNLYPFTDSRR